ncbi:parallel beta-helix repeat (two copies) [Jannaschia faecimaris]|uniref:Parallel beta-helix repeat (Two copies) n=1 Tax=Jannaschia faecimaris TaxID=1244108 RepID=A0A1H3JAB4_9RHOB|nr:DUF4082 domain-containing protein [Jannaschia faecimaris]SDY36891.1 parallel beta-helix repeat (two copies) [Jannaschia faecimaris]
MAVYYVDVNGNDGADGSAGSPFRSISRALDSNLAPGDEIVVRAGTYDESLNINRGGSAAGDVTLRAEVPGTVLIEPSSGWNAISVNANYVTIEGFEIANAAGDGIEADNVHHITVRDNVLHGNGESGIQFNYSDFITVEGNETYGNAASGWYSGISIYQNRNITGDTSTDGFRTIVRNNVSYDNVTYGGAHTDGNGIIIDDFQSTQASGFPNYTFATLVEGNVAYGNGGKGIQVVWSDNVTVRGNTAYHNNVDQANDGTWRGEISNSQSSDNTFVNNIMVADPGINSDNRAVDNTSYGGYSNDNVVWQNNLMFNGSIGQVSARTDGGNPAPSTADGNLYGVDPEFVDPANGNFNLAAGSPAIDSGTGAFGLFSTDVDGDGRTNGTVDIGAQEAGSTAAAAPAPSQPAPAPTPEPAPAPEPVFEPAPAPAPADNTAPEAKTDIGFETSPDSPLILRQADLVANDTDADGDTITISSIVSTKNGEASITEDGDILFTSDGGARATVVYRVTDGNGGFDTARARIKVDEDATPAPVTESAAIEAPAPVLLGLPASTTESGEVTAPLIPTTYQSILTDMGQPFDVALNDTSAVELGMRFCVETAGEIDGFRVWRGEANDAEMPATLWDGNGNAIATATFVDTVDGGWQEVMLDTPIAVEAGQSYTVSYQAPQGTYAYSQGFFDQTISSGALHVEADAGVFDYGLTNAAPTESYNQSNYWIDVLFDAAPDVDSFTFQTEVALDTFSSGALLIPEPGVPMDWFA